MQELTTLKFGWGCANEETPPGSAGGYQNFPLIDSHRHLDGREEYLQTLATGGQ